MRSIALIVLTFILLTGPTSPQSFSPMKFRRQAAWSKDRVVAYRQLIRSPKNVGGVTSVIDTGFTEVGRWGWGPSYAVARDSQFVVLGNGALLQILNWDSGAGSPTIVSEYNVGIPIYQIRIRDSLAYIIGGGGFQILNLSDRNRIKPLGSLAEPDILVALEVVDSIAYTTSWSGVLALIDIRDASSPRFISRVGAPSERDVALAVRNGYCYVGGLDAPLLDIFDARKPDSVKYVGSLGIGGVSQSAVVSDTVLILGVLNTATIQLYSLASPAMPRYLYGVNIPGVDTFSINDLKSVGSRLYVSTNDAGFYEINLADSAIPLVGLHRAFPYKTSAGGSIATSTDGTLYVACDNGVARYDALDSLRYTGFFPTAGTIASITARANLAAISSTIGGLWLLDISDPKAPKQVSNINNGGVTVEALFSGNHIVMYDQQLWARKTVNGGVYIYDISDSSNPKQMSIFEPPLLGSNIQDAVTMCLDSNLLFLAQEQTPGPPVTDVEVVNIADPLHPQQETQMSLPFLVIRMAARSGALYVASRDSGLYIYDYRFLPELRQLGNITKGSTVFALSLKDTLLFLHTGGSISAYNVSQSAAPESLSSFTVNPYLPVEMPIDGHFLYSQVVTSTSGIAGIDISDLQHFAIRGFTQEMDASALAASNGHLFIALQEVGIAIFQNDLILDVRNPKNQEIPTSYRLEQNYPNPFNPSTTISYSLPTRAHAELAFYDLLGRRLGLLVDKFQEPGSYSVQPNLSDFPTGVYFYRLTTQGGSLTRKMIYIK